MAITHGQLQRGRQCWWHRQRVFSGSAVTACAATIVVAAAAAWEEARANAILYHRPAGNEKGYRPEYQPT